MIHQIKYSKRNHQQVDEQYLINPNDQPIDQSSNGVHRFLNDDEHHGGFSYCEHQIVNLMFPNIVVKFFGSWFRVQVSVTL